MILNVTVFFFPTNITNTYFFGFYISILWILFSLRNNFYDIKRHTKIIQIIPLLFRQIILFAFVLYAFIGFFKQPIVSRLALGNYFVLVSVLIFTFKLLTFYLLKNYRSVLSGNSRKIIIIGQNEKIRQLVNTFQQRLDFGYVIKAQFNVRDPEFSLETCNKYVVANDIDEIYFSVSELSNRQINELIHFADNNLRELKFIPDNKDVFSKRLKYEYYEYTPVLSLRTIPLQEPSNQFIKRLFDLVFASVIVVAILSWLTPIIAILIRLDSKGPIFFKQSRNGFNNMEFNCYKFRSMTINNEADSHQALRGDLRITKVGAFLRKSSLDELPQFFNVLFGDMSIVGPRPHMVSHTNIYAKRVNKFMVRHFVKPGITGLAQISGYRGEIESDKDIIGRVKYDIFYIENWSLLLDIRIILKTFLNSVKGEDKAY